PAGGDAEEPRPVVSRDRHRGRRPRHERRPQVRPRGVGAHPGRVPRAHLDEQLQDRKSTRLNSSHVKISYAVFCLKKKKHTTSGKTPWRRDAKNHTHEHQKSTNP